MVTLPSAIEEIFTSARSDLRGAQLVTAGYQGWTMVVTGTGSTIAEAQADAYQLAQRVVIPNVRYRNDIGARLIAGDFAKVESMRLLGD